VDKQITAVYVNMGATRQSRQTSFNLSERRWKFDSATPYITSDAPGDELRRLPPLGVDAPIEIPARSVVTLVAQFA
jgi:hypothetical protein